MIYWAYERVRKGTRPVAWLLDRGHRLARDSRNPLRDTLAMRAVATLAELPARALKDYGKQRYEVFEDLGDVRIRIEPEVVQALPFANLLRFNGEGETRPKLLIAAALSGHHGTLLQDTVQTFVPDFDTYITDWQDARQVPLADGDFGFDDYVAYLMTFIEALGPDTHVVATCQAAPPAMVAVAMLAKRHPDRVPASLTLMGGPIDTRIAPNSINKLTDKVPLKLFQKNNIHKVPAGYPGVGRRVYPGFFQLAGFLALNPAPHLRQYKDFVRNSLHGEAEALERFRAFYDEYFAVLDMTETFYIDTLRKVFFEHHIPTGRMTFRGEPVDFAVVRDLPLLTVEGANDHLCPPGQTQAAHAIFSGIPEALRENHLQEGVGHYGVFSGSKFRSSIYPAIRDFTERSARRQAR